MREIVFIQERCIPGCRACYSACIAEHLRHEDSYAPMEPLPMTGKREEELFDYDLSNPIPHAVRCRNCIDAPCVMVCISGSMQQDDISGRVFNDEMRCVGCWMCVMACPYAALIPLIERRKVLKCDSCLSVDDPACVRACPTKAILFITPEDYQRERRRIARFNEAGKVPAFRVFE